MLFRYALLTATAFISGLFTAMFSLKVNDTWQIPVAIGLSVFVVLLGSFPKRKELLTEAPSLNELTLLTKN